MTLYDQLIENLRQNASSPKIYKFFKFSIEELQDSPEKLESIVEYLEKHNGKWENFDIHTWIDEETFKPIIMLVLTPAADLQKHMSTKRIKSMINYYEKQKNT